MGRPPDSTLGVEELPLLFNTSEIPKVLLAGEKDFRSLVHPLWTENKAKLIQEYIRLFTFVTKHGTYIDGFAAPQRHDRKDLCSANLVLQTEPRWVRDLWLCDIDARGIALLNEMAAKHAEKGRRINILTGDFNVSVNTILGSGQITEKTATFALLDQRTFECHWSTIERLAHHKKGNKIELFYFLATGWLDRSIAAVSRKETALRLDRWWGRDDWRSLLNIPTVPRAMALAARIKAEFGYQYVHPYAIHDRSKGGRTMYHMIHASDHPEAASLMQRAYRKVSGRGEDGYKQVEINFGQID